MLHMTLTLAVKLADRVGWTCGLSKVDKKVYALKVELVPHKDLLNHLLKLMILSCQLEMTKDLNR